MKVLKSLVAVLLAGVLAAGAFGCGSGKATETSAGQEYTVKRGDISNTITAAGNLALSVSEDLPVSLFYQGSSGRGGTVGQVLVQVGDTVKEGQVLVSVDPTEWADQLQNLEDSISTAQRNAANKAVAVTDAQRQLAALQRAVVTAEYNVSKAQQAVASRQLAVTQSQLAVTSANNSLNDIKQVKDLQEQIDNANYTLKLAKSMLIAGVDNNYDYWYHLNEDTYLTLHGGTDSQGNYYQGLLEDMKDLLGGSSTTTSAEVALQVAQKVVALQSAQLQVADAELAVSDANNSLAAARQGVDDANYAVTKQQQTVVNAQADLDSASSSLADAQQKLADALTMSPEVKSPFDGFVTAMNVKAGQSVYNGTIAATVADPDKFEADILVSEMDIMRVSVGGDATMTLNAVPGVTLPAKIIKIAPTATISSGVVNYSVTVNITSIAPVTAGSFPAASANATARFPGASDNATGRFPPALQQAIESGSITQEQADAMRERISAGGGFSGSRAAGQLPSTVTAQSYQLKPGLTGTVELIVAQRSNVLLVPGGAVTTAGNQSTVQVVTANNTTEKRVVQTGLSDWQNTEITSGLAEGETIIVPKAAATTTSSSSSQQPGPPGGGIFFGR